MLSKFKSIPRHGTLVRHYPRNADTVDACTLPHDNYSVDRDADKNFFGWEASWTWGFH